MHSPDPYLAAAIAAPTGAATEDGNGYVLTKQAANRWYFTEPSEDHPGFAEYLLNDAQAADVLENIFPGSFGSPELQ